MNPSNLFILWNTNLSRTAETHIRFIHIHLFCLRVLLNLFLSLFFPQLSTKFDIHVHLNNESIYSNSEVKQCELITSFNFVTDNSFLMSFTDYSINEKGTVQWSHTLFFNLYIFLNLMIFQTLIIWSKIIQRLKFPRSTTSGYTDLGIRTFGFVIIALLLFPT